MTESLPADPQFTDPDPEDRTSRLLVCMTCGGVVWDGWHTRHIEWHRLLSDGGRRDTP